MSQARWHHQGGVPFCRARSTVQYSAEPIAAIRLFPRARCCRETAITKHIRGPFATPSDEETMAKSISETLASKYPHM